MMKLPYGAAASLPWLAYGLSLLVCVCVCERNHCVLLIDAAIARHYGVSPSTIVFVVALADCFYYRTICPRSISVRPNHTYLRRAIPFADLATQILCILMA